MTAIVTRRRAALFSALLSATLLAAACQAHDARQQGQDTERLAGSVRRSRIVPLRWSSDSARVVFLRIDQFAAGDVGRVACDSTGIYERSADGHLVARSTGTQFCNSLWHADAVALSPDGQHLLYTTSFEPGRLISLELSRMARADVSLDCSPSGDAIAWSPHDARIVTALDCAKTAPTLQVSNPDGGARRVLVTWKNGKASAPAWSPDSRRILVVRDSADSPPEIRVIDTVTGGQHVVARGIAPAWAPDGESIAYVPADTSRRREIHRVALDGRNDRVLRRLPDHLAGVSEPWQITGPLLWSPRGDALVVTVNASAWLVPLTDSTAPPIRVP